MAKQPRQTTMGQHLGTFWEKIEKSIPLSNGLAALLMIGLQEIFNQITDCPCNFGVPFGWVTIMGPIVILVVSLLTPIYEACRARRDPDKKTRLAYYGALTFVASMSWVSVALLNSEALCCIQGGFPSDSPCLAGGNATNNVLLYEKCISDSWIAGATMMTIGGILSSIILTFVHIKCGHLDSIKDPNIPMQSIGA
ncbi:unnamed protein product [Lampetra fluviatilis]